MEPYFSEEYGNPGGLYALGQRAQDAVEGARRDVARLLGCAAAEIIFTSGGSESINLALRGVTFAVMAGGKWQGSGAPPHIITSAVEHHAVGHTCEQLHAVFGVDVTTVGVDRWGRVEPEAVRAAIRPNTALISIMLANNEIGTVQPIAAIGAIARERGIPFHTDAAQAAAYMDINVEALKVDLLSLGAHKFYGPKGVGILYVRGGTRFEPMQTGGGQEQNRRAGTENVAYIVGLAKAFSLARAQRSASCAQLLPLRDRLMVAIPETIAGARLTGHPSERLPHNASFVIAGIEAGPLLTALDLAGIAASSGSACTSASMEPSHVLTALGLSRAEAAGALRLTLGSENRAEEIDTVLETLPEAVARLRHV